MPLAPEGWAFIGVPAAIAVLLLGLGWWKSALAFLAGAAFMLWFFRDPERTAPSVPGAVLAPADGRVVDLRAEVDDPFVGTARLVGIFLSPLDVHVNRAPIAGRVVSVDYRPGAFLAAYRPAAAERNEQTRIAIQGETARVVVRQIAGVLARRIVCRVRAGDALAAGDRLGMIRFGSRTDVLLPRTATVLVRAGDRVRAGETVVGVLP